MMRKFKAGDHIIATWGDYAHKGIVIERYCHNKDYALIMATSGHDKGREVMYKDKYLKYDLVWYREERLKQLLDEKV